METMYSILGVDRQVESKELKEAYYRKASEHHPDRGGDADTMAKINRAYLVLEDPVRRERYDNELKLLAEACITCDAAGVVFKQVGKGFNARREKKLCTTCGGGGFLRWKNKPPKDTIINLSGAGKRARRK